MSVIVCIPIGAIGRQLVSGTWGQWTNGNQNPCVTKTRDVNTGRKGDTQHKRKKVVCDGEVGAHQTNGHKNNSTGSQKSLSKSGKII